MSERICSEPECGEKVRARGLCPNHYNARRKSKTLPQIPPKQLEIPLKPVHRVTNVDRETAVADCEVCGPQVPVRVRKRRGAECKAGVAEHLRQLPRHIDRRAERLRRKYGLSTEKYEAMVAQQEGQCLICASKPEKLVVDHDHATGKVRGLLCHFCNVAIGFLRDNPELALSAARYLSQ